MLVVADVGQHGTRDLDRRCPTYAFNVELSPNGWFAQEFEAAWGFAFETVDTESDWALDVQALFDALEVVTDNSAATPGGAGARLQPLLPELSAIPAAPAMFMIWNALLSPVSLRSETSA